MYQTAARAFGWPVAISGDIGFFAEIAESTATGRHRYEVTIRARNLSHFVWFVHFLASVVLDVITERTDQLVNGGDRLFLGITSALVQRVDVDPLQRRQYLMCMFFPAHILTNTIRNNSCYVG
ncbi:hypothetical protein C444_08100 [Haloarcula japonica DSM 6131]|uniref:Uncharacterized protein n=2 Tax=Haloarcula TaxID=2237 RepID=A0A830EN86_9EURY|nr:hypothetical protein C444_08100 [Haloarcula japonica DSM 6131]GGK78611.1 hypothetical protein GCM10009067_33710 [Haloarcula sebkhae]